MTPITHTVEIARSQEDVFAYLEQLERHGEWQDQIVSATKVTEGPVGVGTRATERRKVPVGERDVTYEITEYDPPRRAAFRGIDGPIRAIGAVTVEPAGEGRSRVTVELDLVGHGAGKLLGPLARMDARKSVPANQQKLKERLESGA